MPVTIKGSGQVVVQIVQGSYGLQVTNATNTYNDTMLTASITPTSASNRILVLVNQSGVNKQSNNTGVDLRLVRNSTEISVFAINAATTTTTTENGIGSCSLAFLDSPNTTSSVTYKTQFSSRANVGNAVVQHNNVTSTIVLMEISG